MAPPPDPPARSGPVRQGYDAREWMHEARREAVERERGREPRGRDPGARRATRANSMESSEDRMLGRPLGRRLHDLEHPRHLGVDLLDRLQGTDHHLEVDDLALVVPADHVDAVDDDPVDLGPELEHRVVRTRHLAHVLEGALARDRPRRPRALARIAGAVRVRLARVAGEDVEGRHQVETGEIAAPLRGVDDGRVEDDVLREDLVEGLRAHVPHDAMPGLESGLPGHSPPPLPDPGGAMAGTVTRPSSPRRPAALFDSRPR